MLFGVVFVRRSSVLGSDAFIQTDATHWVLNLSALAGDAACTDVRDVCLFVPGGCSLPPDAGLSCHVSSGASFEYRGYVSNETPSDVFPSAWGASGRKPAAAGRSPGGGGGGRGGPHAHG